MYASLLPNRKPRRHRTMMRVVSVAGVVSMALPVAAISAAIEPKVGGACSKPKATSFDAGGKAVVCVTKNGKKVWQLAGVSTTAAPTSTAAATVVAPAKGLAKTAGFDGKTVKVGVITALSGPAAVLGKQGDQDVTGQVNDLRKGGCQVVFAASLPTEFGKILGTAAQLGFSPQWIGQSPSWVDSLLLTPLKDYMTARVLIVAVGPEWADPTVPAAVAYAARVKQYKPDQKPDYYFTFGYFQAQATAQLLEKAAALGNLNREGIVKAMNSLDKLTFDGLASDFRYGPPEKRDPSRFSTIFKVDPAAPFGLRSVLFNFTSEAARAYTFPKAK